MTQKCPGSQHLFGTHCVAKGSEGATAEGRQEVGYAGKVNVIGKGHVMSHVVSLVLILFSTRHDSLNQSRMNTEVPLY